MSRKAKQRRNQGYTDNNLIEISNYIQKQVNLIPRNLNQETYIDLLLNPKNIITFDSRGDIAIAKLYRSSFNFFFAV